MNWGRPYFSPSKKRATSIGIAIVLLLIWSNQLPAAPKPHESEHANAQETIAPPPSKTGFASFEFFHAEKSLNIHLDCWYPVAESSAANHSLGLWKRCAEARNAPIADPSAKYPLIMLSHGLRGDPLTLAWLAERMVANGYIVVGVEHEDTWKKENNKSKSIQFWERALDISRSLDFMMEQSPLKDQIDAQRIGFAGYSLGGTTGALIAGGRFGADEELLKAVLIAYECPPETVLTTDFYPAFQSFQDDRFKAFVLFAPALGTVFGGNGFGSVDAPCLIFANKIDGVVPYDEINRFFSNIKAHSLKIYEHAAGHFLFCNSPVSKMTLKPELVVERSAEHILISGEAIAFFNSTLE